MRFSRRADFSHGYSDNMYGIDLSVQIENLMPALGIGFILGFVYDIVRFLRMTLSKNKFVLFFADFLFVVFCTISSYLMILGVNDGNIRLYLIVAEITGSAIYFCTAGLIISRVFRLISDTLRKFFRTIITPFILVFKKFGCSIQKTAEKIKHFFKKIKNKSKKLLKDKDEMLYNNYN